MLLAPAEPFSWKRGGALAARMLILLAAALPATACSNDDLEKRRAAAGPSPTLERLMQVADADAGGGAFGGCARCHTVGSRGRNKAGPNLHAIMGAKIAGNPRYGYSAALEGVKGRWTRAAMDRWLADPQAFAPGTRMAYPGIRDPLIRADLIRYLEGQGG